MAWDWYGVKTFYRWEAKGRPIKPDQNYDPKITLLEERVVLFKARNFDEAIRKAEKEARAYASGTVYINIYGQKVRMIYLKRCDAYKMFDSPAANIEVYSASEILDRDQKYSTILDSKLGQTESPLDYRKRLKFFDRDLAEMFTKEAKVAR